MKRYSLPLVLFILFVAMPVGADTLFGVAQSSGGPTAPSTLYRINDSTGVARPVGPIGFDGVGGMDFQPATGTLYAVGKNGSGMSVLITIDTKTGQGTEVGQLTGIDTGVFGGLFDVSFRNSDRVLYIAALDDPDVSIYTIDVETGAATLIGVSGYQGSGNGIGFTLADDLFLASSSDLVSINQTAGVGSLVTTFSFAGFPLLNGPSITAADTRPADGETWVAVNDGSAASGPNYVGTLNTVTGTVGNEGVTVNGLTALAWRPEFPVVPQGLLFGGARAGGPTSASTLYSIDPASGSTASIGPIGFNGIGGIDFHPATRRLVGVAKRTGDDVDVLIEINPATGAGTEIGPLVNIAPATGGLDLSFRPDGSLYLGAKLGGGNVALYSVNQSTGEATLIGDTLTNGTGNGLGYSPGSALYLGSGLNLFEVDDANAMTTSSTALGYIGFPTLSAPRIAAIDFAPTYDVPFAVVDDGTAGSGPNYLAYFDTSTSSVFNVGPSINGLTSLAWRPPRDPCSTLIFGAARTASGSSPSIFYEIDPATGVALPLGKIGFNEVRGLSMQPGTRELFAIGRRFFDDEPVLLTIDTATGAGTEVGPLNTDVSADHYDLAFRRNAGVLVMLAQDSMSTVTLYTVDPVSGQATAVGPTTTSSAGNGLAFNLDNTLFHADDASGGTLRTSNFSTGASSTGVGMTYSGFPMMSGPEPNALAFDHETGAGYVAVDDSAGQSGPNYLGSLDTATGTVTHIGATADRLDAIESYAGCADVNECTVDTCSTCQSLLYGATHRGGALGASTLRVIDPNTGGAVPVGPIGFNDVGGLDFHPTTGILYGVGRRTTDSVAVLIAINPLSGVAREIGPLTNTTAALGENHYDLSFRANGTLYLSALDGSGDLNLYTVNLTSGVAVAIGLAGTTGGDNALTVSGSDVMYQADDASGGTLYTVNPATGAATSTGTLIYNGFPTLVAPRPNAIDFEICDPTTATISIDDGSNGFGPNYIGELDVTTGVVTYVGTTFSGLDALAWRDVGLSFCTYVLFGDTDMDTVCDPADNCPSIFNTNQADYDMDNIGNPCDVDDDNDGVNDGADSDQFNEFVCRDVEPDTCDDCSSGMDDPANDGPDADSEGICDAGDNCDDDPNYDQANWDGDALGDACDPDDDNDGVDDGMDSAQFNEFVCRDVDADTCDDCTSGSDDVANDGSDYDGDGLCDAGDPDDDDDGVADGMDSAQFNEFVCRDVDADTCDDCTSGIDNTANDGIDTDSDTICDAGDNCDTTANPAQANWDGDSLGDACDPDDDNDGVVDGEDSSQFNNFVCRDVEPDACDDCSSGFDDPANDGSDYDGDGLCDSGDPDDDNDGVDDGMDSAQFNNFVCRDVDADGCDDCTSGADDVGNDGPDYDGDGLCDAGDPDDDNDGIGDGGDWEPLNEFACRDVDNDSCDDCSGGHANVNNDGPDFDADGICDAGDNCDMTANPTQANWDEDSLGDACDPDDDNDGVVDGEDSDTLNNFVCRDVEGDTCDDCSSGTNDPANDGTDTDGEGICDAGDNCDLIQNLGQEDFDTDGLGDVCDPDADGDGVENQLDSAQLNNFLCGDFDTDGCEDCISGVADPFNDGTDTDGEGVCDVTDNCVNHPNPLQESKFAFPETVLAQDKDTFVWATPTDIVYAVGVVPNLPTYTTGAIDNRSARTQFVVGDPPPNTTRWYLVRVDCPVGVWASGGANECPSALGCPNGGRDDNLP